MSSKTLSADTPLVGKPDAYWLRAIQDPKGKSRGRGVAIDLPTKPHTQITPVAMAGFLHGPPGKLAKDTDLIKQIQAFTSGPS